MDYVVAIPSYGRENIITKKTLPLLLKCKVSPHRIFIFVADKEEEAKYREAVPKEDYHRLIVGKKGISYQRNFIIDYFPNGKEIVFMDDDISQVVRKKNGHIGQIADMDEFFRQSFMKIHHEKLYLWATKNQYSAFYRNQMREEGEVGLVQFSGDLMGIINRKDMKISITLAKGEAEQIELLLKYVKRDGGILRFNNVVVISHKLTPGGKVKERGSVEARKKDIEPNLKALVKAYPELTKKVINRGVIANRDRSTVELADFENRFIKGAAKPIRRTIEGDEDTSRRVLPIRDRTAFVEAREKLLKVLRETRVPTLGKARPKGSTRSTGRADVIGSIGRTMTFGFGDTRKGIKEFKKNKEHPELLRRLADFGNLCVPLGWDYNAITLNEGVKAKKHKDSKNLGPSVIIGIGDFTGGEIRVWDKDDKNPKDYNLHDHPVMFNGGLLFHETQPFDGERYTIIFYKQMWEGKVKGVRMVGKGEMDDEEEEECEGGIFA
jgi:hypothetical protein